MFNFGAHGFSVKSVTKHCSGNPNFLIKKEGYLLPGKGELSVSGRHIFLNVPRRPERTMMLN